jgi:hypothetical protein
MGTGQFFGACTGPPCKHEVVHGTCTRPLASKNWRKVLAPDPLASNNWRKMLAPEPLASKKPRTVLAPGAGCEPAFGNHRWRRGFQRKSRALIRACTCFHL